MHVSITQVCTHASAVHVCERMRAHAGVCAYMHQSHTLARKQDSQVLRQHRRALDQTWRVHACLCAQLPWLSSPCFFPSQQDTECSHSTGEHPFKSVCVCMRARACVNMCARACVRTAALALISLSSLLKTNLRLQSPQRQTLHKACVNACACSYLSNHHSIVVLIGEISKCSSRTGKHRVRR